MSERRRARDLSIRRQRRALLQLPTLPYPKTLTDVVELEPHDLSDTTENGLFDL